MYVRLKMLILMFLLYRLQSLGLTGGLSQNRRGIILKNKDPGQFDFELFLSHRVVDVISMLFNTF